MIYKKHIFNRYLLVVFLLSFLHQANAKDKLTLLAGYDYSQGDYGSQTDTKIKYIPISIKLEKSRLVYKLTIPHITITGPGNLVGRDTISGGSVSNTITTESGLGDIVAAVSYNLLPYQLNRPLIDLTAKVKIPTADESRGLGSGKFDFYFQADGLYSIKKTSLFGTLGYKIYGDTPNINYKNVYYYTLGTNYLFSENISAGVVYDYREASTRNGFERKEFTAYINKKLNSKMKLLGYLVRGLSDGSPDLGIGFSLSYLL